MKDSTEVSTRLNLKPYDSRDDYKQEGDFQDKYLKAQIKQITQSMNKNENYFNTRRSTLEDAMNNVKYADQGTHNNVRLFIKDKIR